MANSIFSRNRRLYVVPTVTFGTAVAPANSNALRYVNFVPTPQQIEAIRPDINPALDITIGVLGRKSCTFQGSASLAGSAAAGTPPDIGPFLNALMGNQTIVAATSVTYNDADVLNYVDCYQYVSPSTGVQEAMISSCIKTGEINFGDNYATFSWTGSCKSYLDSNSFASIDTEGKCGLAAFPTEPVAPVTNGAAISGYKGTITLDGNVYTIARNGKITRDNRVELQNDGWGSDYPQAGALGVRDTTFDISLYDDDSANLGALKGKATTGTSVNASFVMGTVAGGVYTITLRNILLSKPTYDNSGVKRIVNFTGNKAHASSGTAKDAMTIQIT